MPANSRRDLIQRLKVYLLVTSGPHQVGNGIALPLHSVTLKMRIDFFHIAAVPSGSRPPQYLGFTITLKHTTLVRTSLDEWSARPRELYLKTHSTHKSHTHAAGGIRTRNPNIRAAAGSRLRPRSHRYWRPDCTVYCNCVYCYVSVCTVQHTTNSVPLESAFKILNPTVSRCVAEGRVDKCCGCPGRQSSGGGGQNGCQN